VLVVVSTFPTVSVLEYLTYCSGHVVPAVHVTDTPVPIVIGVQAFVVSTQYLVVLVSFGVRVTVKSVALQMRLTPLGVVTGAKVSIHVQLAVKFVVLFSLSLIWITQLSVPT